ncbi:MAG: UDP-N-acetylmuramoyl-L-alanine--D-glutamate ligase [Candidatus Mcinerneyibacterium aminivorans]|uniref:UDP-N-acetylmuramoylalanine--D-glutamate ligase n=1 Tax=Candidatus Mcinerneyibacterium aminivorans TaxID=2703815 RepID=A0A5D0MGX7_9BACT|nr:MAG: UDP-N-acetylmuramoyl-L-alanine--D-glutamate ligase [Candidatus Mcinerneyibacterium aminivorans]
MDIEGILVIGLGRSGLGAARLANRHNIPVYVTEQSRNKHNEEKFRELDKLCIPYETDNTEKFFKNCNLAVISPGIDPENEYIKKVENEMKIISELEFAYKFKKSNQKIIGVTGTNGKSTTTTIIHDLLEEDGKKVALTGNIGFPLSDYIDDGYDYFACEISSYQLEKIEKFGSDVAVLLNVTPDHLNRYDQNFEKYFDAKKRIFENNQKNTISVLNADQPELQVLAGKIREPVYLFNMNEPVKKGAYIFNGKMVFREANKLEEIVDLANIKAKGIHNIENMLASICATYKHVENKNIYKKVFSKFENLEHRLEEVKKINGILFINDSKATNIESAQKALKSFNDNKINLILGGDDSKKSDFSVLYSDICEKCKNVILLGETTDRLKKELKDYSVNILTARDMKEAVDIAFKNSSKGDIVLLSPAAASFDMYDSYEHRGQIFKECIMELKGNE